MITEKEYKCIELTKDLFNEFIKLPIEHKADCGDFTYHIHALQNIILSRCGLRELREKEGWTFKNEHGITSEDVIYNSRNINQQKESDDQRTEASIQ